MNICLTCGEEFDATPKPKIVIAGKVVKWYPTEHLHMKEYEG